MSRAPGGHSLRQGWPETLGHIVFAAPRTPRTHRLGGSGPTLVGPPDSPKLRRRLATHVADRSAPFQIRGHKQAAPMRNHTRACVQRYLCQYAVIARKPAFEDPCVRPRTNREPEKRLFTGVRADFSSASAALPWRARRRRIERCFLL